MGVYTHSDGNWLTRRGTFLIILIVFHVALFWAIKSGFAVQFVKSITEPIKAEIINEVKPQEPPPPPPEIKMELPPVQVPPVLVDIPNPPEPAPTVLIAEPTTKPQPPAPPPPPRPAATRAGYAYKPSTEDFYPNASRNLGEEGVSRIHLCYDEKGKVTDSTLSETSKFQRLDDAAVRMGKLFRIKPGSIDGRPQADCVTVPIRFSLKGEE